MTVLPSSLSSLLLGYLLLLKSCHPSPLAGHARKKNSTKGILVDHGSKTEQSCTWDDDRNTCTGGEKNKDPNLVPMTVDFGDNHLETVDVYVTPDVATFYNETPGSRTKKETAWRGQFGKFINMSPQPVRVYWVPPSGQKSYIADIAAFGSAGTATFPNHKFVVTDQNDPNKELRQWTIKEFTSLYKYDPFESSLEKAREELSSAEFNLYRLQYRSLAFDRAYRHRTGRQWLALYGRKHKPRFYMWPADSIGQTHQVVTRETHFVSQPPEELAKAHMSLSTPTAKDLQIRKDLQPYRSPDESLTLNMTVLSVAPRVFEIKNFLSHEEVTHILEIATGIQLSRSTTRAGDAADATTSDDTRTSFNSWISRHQTPVVDSIYRRAADLLQIDEACFRNRRDQHELDLVVNSTGPITERYDLPRIAATNKLTASSPSDTSLYFCQAATRALRSGATVYSASRKYGNVASVVVVVCMSSSA